MNDRDDLEAALRASGSAPVPPIDPSFADALEQRLLAQAASSTDVSPIARRARRISAATAVATTLTFVGAAAAAGIVTSQHADRPTLPATTTTTPTPTTMTTTSTGVATTTIVVVVETTVVAELPSSTEPAETAPPTTVVSTVATTVPVVEPTTVVATTVPATTIAPPAPTEPPTTLSAPPPQLPPPATSPGTTEVRTPATITITCAPSAGAVTCSWTPGPGSTAQYLVLRSIPGSTSPGRAFFVDAGTLTWTDPMATTGTTYAYLVHARDAAGTSLAHSDLVQVGCC